MAVHTVKEKFIYISAFLLLIAAFYAGSLQTGTDEIGGATRATCEKYMEKYGREPWFSDWAAKECKDMAVVQELCGNRRIDSGEECDTGEVALCSEHYSDSLYSGSVYCRNCRLDLSSCRKRSNCSEIQDSIDSLRKKITLLEEDMKRCNSGGESRYRNAHYLCSNGVETYEGSDSNCKSEAMWKSYGRDFCQGACTGANCTLSQFEAWNDCTG